MRETQPVREATLFRKSAWCRCRPVPEAGLFPEVGLFRKDDGMRIRPAGAHALLLDCSDADADADAATIGANVDDTADTADTEHGDAGRAAAMVVADRVEAWRAELWRLREQGDLDAVEIVPAATTVLLDGLSDPAHTAALLNDWTPTPISTGTASTDATSTGTTSTGTTSTGAVEVPVIYDGVDLATVAGHWNVDVTAVVRRLTATEFRVAFCGFAPGFAYLTGLAAGLSVPRLSTPRSRVPAGSVALAGPYAGIYPTAAPGGWLLVGRTDLPLFDVHADPPARLAPGTRVRLVAA